MSESIHHVSPAIKPKAHAAARRKHLLDFYRFLYGAVGQEHHLARPHAISPTPKWPPRLIHEDGVEIWVLYVGGQPAGYFELVPREENTIEIGILSG